MLTGSGTKTYGYMFLLLIDTSSVLAKVIVATTQGKIIVELSNKEKNKHVEELCGLVVMAFKMAGLSLKDFSHIFVINYPGGYSSIRVGISFGNALKICLKTLILLSVTKFDIIAEASAQSPPYGIIIPSGTDRYALKIYTDTEDTRVISVNTKEALILNKNLHLIGEAIFLPKQDIAESKSFVSHAVTLSKRMLTSEENTYLKTSNYTQQIYNKTK